MVAGVTIPGVSLLALAAAPYLDKNPSMRPENRKLAIMLFTTFAMMFWAVLVIIKVYFRGPGFNWIWPWTGCSSSCNAIYEEATKPMAVNPVRPAAPRPSRAASRGSPGTFLRTAWLAAIGAGLAGFGAGTVYFCGRT